MKKILSILLMLVLVSGVVFAQLTPTVTANAAVNWGIDLGAGKTIKAQHGFENYLFAQVMVPLYMGTLSSKTEGDVHIEFDLGANLAYRYRDAKSNSTSPYVAWDSDMEFSLWRKTLNSMSASLHFFGGYLNVNGRPDFSTNFAQIWSPIRDDNARGPKTSGDITGFGTKIGYAAEDLAGTGIKLDTGIKLGSNGSWKAKGEDGKPGSTKYEIVELKAGDTVKGSTFYKNDGSVMTFTGAENTVGASEAGLYIKKVETAAVPAKDAMHSKYAFGWDLSFGYKKWVTLDFGINATFNPVSAFGKAGIKSDTKSNPAKPYIGFGFKLGSEPVEGLKLKFGSDILVTNVTGNMIAADVLFDVAYKWVSFGIYYGNKASAYTAKKGTDTIGDLAMMLAFKSEDKGDTNFVENLAFGVDFRLNHLLYSLDFAKNKVATVPLGFKTWVSYKYPFSDAMWIKPYVNVYGETNHSARLDGTTGKDYFGIAYDLGVIFAPVEKVELSAKWSHGKLNWNKYEGFEKMINTPANHRAHNGTFVLGVKIIY